MLLSGDCTKQCQRNSRLVLAILFINDTHNSSIKSIASNLKIVLHGTISCNYFFLFTQQKFPYYGHLNFFIASFNKNNCTEIIFDTN